MGVKLISLKRYISVALLLGGALSCAVSPTNPLGGWGLHGLSTMKSYWQVEENGNEAFAPDMKECQAGYAPPPGVDPEGSETAKVFAERGRWRGVSHAINYEWIEGGRGLAGHYVPELRGGPAS